MKEDLQSDPIIYDGLSRRDLPDPSNAELRDYILAMIDQLAVLADGNDEPLIGAMLAEVARRNRV